MKDFIHINKLDNVAVALNPLNKNQQLSLDD